jgi:hypothetical protein
VQHTRFAELAVVDSSDPKEDGMVVVPGSMLQPGARVSNDLLPFDVEVERYMPNSALRDRAPDDRLPDDLKGAGRLQTAVERGEVAGTSTKQTVEYPSAYVRFVDKGSSESLGSYLMSAWLDPQPVTVGGKTYRVALRFKRSYKPYSLYLYEFRFDRYPGTDIAKNFSSRVRLVDPERGEDREVLIRMNEPLRHRGETFYQQSFDEKTEKATILQVVRNPGWLMPYVSCALVSLGMLAHFGITLVGFLQRRLVP